MKTKILFITSLLLIVGCSKPVEDSTLINKVGLMYLPDSDSPYTGEVFTNYDTGEKEYQGTYENGLLVTYSYLNKDGTVKEPVNGDSLIDRSGLLSNYPYETIFKYSSKNLFYEVNGQKPYTGDVFELYREGVRKGTGILKGGRLNGLATSWYESGEKNSEHNFKDGIKNGLATEWYKNGKKKSEKNYKDGEPVELSDYRWYQNGQKSSEEKYMFWEVRGGRYPIYSKYWYENGQKSNEFNYKDGKADGLWTWWYENGQKKKEITFKDEEDISSKMWNKDGSVKE